MNDNELKGFAVRIFGKVCTKEAEFKDMEELLDDIKSVLIEVIDDATKLGRTQIINHIQTTLNDLKR